jgi:uncharacterized membrane protein
VAAVQRPQPSFRRSPLAAPHAVGKNTAIDIADTTGGAMDHLFTPIILMHVATAVGAVAIGGVTLAMKKGTRLHRIGGRTWVALMVVTALLSFGIKTNGHFSWIHLISIGTLVAVTMGIVAVLRGNLRAHRRSMTLTYIGLCIAGAFTLLPHRILGQIVWQGIGLA